MKLEVGMYYRSKLGKIKQVTEDDLITKQDYKIADYNLLALVEVGDLINKKEVMKIIHFEGDTFYRIELFGGKAIMNSKDIKSFVTKEQYEGVSYEYI